MKQFMLLVWIDHSIVSRKNGKPKLKHTHNYYYQVQGQLAITGRLWCDFIIYTAKDICVERILFDSEFWSSMEAKLVDFYINCVLPLIVHHKGVDAVSALMVE